MDTLTDNKYYQNVENKYAIDYPQWLQAALFVGKVKYLPDSRLEIVTKRGNQIVNIGDYIYKSDDNTIACCTKLEFQCVIKYHFKASI